MTWAALIKCVYEVDPLKCPKCGGEMRIVPFIDENAIIRKILKHCGLWKEPVIRPPSEEKPPPGVEACTEQSRSESVLDYGFTSTALSAGFEKTCA
jgi:hypothetical protein